VTKYDPSLLLPPQSLEGYPGNPIAGCSRYDRISGFFSFSLLEVTGEALERMAPEDGETCVRMVCNSCLNHLDVQTVAPET